jgi:hypothetical protein
MEREGLRQLFFEELAGALLCHIRRRAGLRELDSLEAAQGKLAEKNSTT